MKNLLLALSLVGLSGCTLVDAYLMTKYDPNEYRIIAEIRNDATVYKAQCDDATVSKSNAQLIADKTQLFEFYSQHIPRNTDSYSASKELNKIAQGLKERYTGTTTVSSAFCKLKYDGIANSANTIQHTLGGRPR